MKPGPDGLESPNRLSITDKASTQGLKADFLSPIGSKLNLAEPDRHKAENCQTRARPESLSPSMLQE